MNNNTIDDEVIYSKLGFLGTLLWGLTIALVFVVSQTAVFVMYINLYYADVATNEYMELIHQLQYNGTVISICTFVTLIVCSLLIFAIVKLKKGSNMKHYLGLNKVNLKTVGFWFFILILLIIASDLLTLFTDRPLVPEFMHTAYKSADSLWLLWLAIIIAGPIFEELFFRGFLMSGFSSSFVGPIGAIFITSLSWALIHLQYDFYGVATIFIFGLFLGFIKYKTESVLLTMGLHSFMNLAATIEASIYLS